MFVDQKSAGMEQLQTHNEATASDPTMFVTRAIQALLQQSDGISLSIDGEDGPYRFRGGIVTNVKVNSAWIMFSCDDCTLRTKEIKDCVAFLKFLTEGGSLKDIHFIKVHGTLLRPVEKEEVKKCTSFLPRSRTFGRTIQSVP